MTDVLQQQDAQTRMKQQDAASMLNQCSIPDMSMAAQELEEVLKVRMAHNINHQMEIKSLTLSKNAAYSERNKCVAALAVAMKNLGYEVYRSLHDGADWEDDWRNILFIESPFGQFSWHFHDSELYLLSMFPMKENKWDGSMTDEKYSRLLAFTITKGMPTPRTRTKKSTSEAE